MPWASPQSRQEDDIDWSSLIQNFCLWQVNIALNLWYTSKYIEARAQVGHFGNQN